MKRWIVGCLVGGLLPGAALAQMAGDTPLRTLEPGAAGSAWQAVGRLNLDQMGFCTATLIAPDRVLTAAHCLFDPETGARIDDSALEFLAGWRIGHAEAIRGVRRAAIAPEFRMADARTLSRVASDLAILQLDQPIRLNGAAPFAVAAQPPDRGAAVAVVSYARGRESAPSLQDRCTVLDRFDEGVVVMSCSIDSGASGAPVFAIEQGTPRIVAVISAMAESGGTPISLGMRLDTQIARLMAELDQPQAPVQRLRSTPAPGAEGARATARFLRP